MTETFSAVSQVPFRVLWPNLFEPKAFVKDGKPTGKPKYGFTAMWPKGTDITNLKQAAVAAAQAAWPGLENLTKGAVRFPFKDGDKEADELLTRKTNRGTARTEEQVKMLRGNILLKASTEYPPQIVGPNSEPLLDKAAVYMGCYGLAQFVFVAREVNGSRYVSAYFNFFAKARDGERLGGKDAKTVFKGLLGGESNVDPSDGDEIPF